MLHPPPPQIPSTLTAALPFSIQTAAQAKILGVPLCSSLLTTLQMVQCQVLSTLPSGYALKLTTAPWVSRSRHLLPSPNYLMISYRISMLSLSPLLKPEWASMKHTEHVTQPFTLSKTSYDKPNEIHTSSHDFKLPVFWCLSTLQLLCPFPATLTFLLPNTAATGHWTFDIGLQRLRNWISHFI